MPKAKSSAKAKRASAKPKPTPKPKATPKPTPTPKPKPKATRASAKATRASAKAKHASAMDGECRRRKALDRMWGRGTAPVTSSKIRATARAYGIALTRGNEPRTDRELRAALGYKKNKKRV